MLRTSLFFPLALAAQLLSAQDLHIYYDAYSDSVYYLLGGKPVDRPIVRKGNQVFMHVHNYNNYLYRAEVKTDRRESALAQGSSLSPLSKLLSKGGGGNIAGLFFGATDAGGEIPDLDLEDQLNRGGFGIDKAAMKKLVEEMQTLETQFTETQDELETLDKDMVKIQKKVQNALETQQIQAFAAEEIQRLRYDPRLSPAQIKKLTAEYMTRIFDDTDPQQLDLSKVLEKANAAELLNTQKAEYDKKLAEYDEKVEVLKTTYGALQDARFNFENSNVGAFRGAAKKLVASSEKNKEIHRTNIGRVEGKMGEIASLDAQTLTQLRTDYLITMENDFSKTIREAASGDKMSLQVLLTPAVDSGAAIRELAPIEVAVYGGFQVNASVGLSFGQFFTRPLEYFVRDSTIQSSKLDAFTPYLSSYFHFYSQSRGAVSAGGSFGVGIPLGNGAGFESLAFFLGPSLMFGRNDRIVLSAGIMGGKTRQLAGGYSVGDTFEADADLLKTESRYNLGYFVGLSFNLLGGKN